MKGLLVAMVLAAVAVVLFAWRNELPEPPVSVGARDAMDGGVEPSPPEPVRSQVEFPVPVEPVIDEPPPEPTKRPDADVAQVPAWAPTVAEFVEAGLTQLEAEWLVGGLRSLIESAGFTEEAEKASGQPGVQSVSCKLVLQLGPTLASRIKEKRIAVKSVEFKRPAPGGALSTFGVGHGHDGKVTEFSFVGRDSRGAVTLTVPLDVLDRELLRALEAAEEQQFVHTK